MRVARCCDERVKGVEHTGEEWGREEQCMGIVERGRQVNMRKKGERTYGRIGGRESDIREDLHGGSG